MWGGSVLLASFLFFRLLYIFFYAWKIQPWRRVCFVVGMLDTMALGVWSLVLIYQNLPETPWSGEWIALSTLWIFLIFKMFSVACLTAHARNLNKSPAAPEDYKRLYYFLTSNHKEIRRYLRSHGNDIEVLLIFLLLTTSLLDFHFTVNRSSFHWAIIVPLILFVFTRTMHTYFYIKAKQPWRSAVWLLDMLILTTVCLAVICVDIIALIS